MSNIPSALRKIVRENFHGLAFFFRYMRWRIFFLFAMSVIVGLMDGFSLAMFMPLIELMSSEQGVTAASIERMGSLGFLVEGITSLGITLNLTVVLSVIIGFILIKGVFLFAATYLNAAFQHFLIRRLREEGIYNVAHLRYDYFVNSDAGMLQNSLSSEIERTNTAFANYMQVIQNGILVAVYFTLAFLSNPKFAMLVVIGAASSNLLFNWIYKATVSASQKVTTAGHGFHGLLIQLIAFFKYLKATGRANDYADKLIEKVVTIERENRRIGLYSAIILGMREPLVIGVVILIIIIHVNFLSGVLGAIVLSVLFFYRSLSYVMNLQSSFNAYLSFSAALENVKELAEELSANRRVHVGETYRGIKKSLSLRDVTFQYGSSKILQNVKLDVHRNETLAIVGESGSGKTTLMNLLSGLLTPTSGQFLIDGEDFAGLSPESYQRRIGYITQEPVIFDESVFNNVTFWDEDTPESRERCHRALEQASVLDFVMSQEDGLDARLGNNGINLSGGQKQRISIARELYKEVDFLFLDEATSALDSETERVIQQNIESLKGKFTILIIAHRLSTVKNADRVVILKGGRIESTGTYQELMKTSDIFKRMVELQEL